MPQTPKSKLQVNYHDASGNLLNAYFITMREVKTFIYLQKQVGSYGFQIYTINKLTLNPTYTR